ncbi:MAG: hypothetical protein GY805_04755 [Chloroflexi bacterium]|nr:hypothetical protein [Chloroflexota bacterium]
MKAALSLPFATATNGDLVFISRANNLMPDDSNDTFDVFVWDAETGQISRVSTASDGSKK